LKLQESIGIEPPLFVLLTLTGVKGYKMELDPTLSVPPGGEPIERDLIAVPDVLVDAYGCDLARVMKPAFDTVWNACGWSRSMNYDESGKRRSRSR
jgi:ATP-dependent helicase YprA (DUF1998 family)